MLIEPSSKCNSWLNLKHKFYLLYLEKKIAIKQDSSTPCSQKEQFSWYSVSKSLWFFFFLKFLLFHLRDFSGFFSKTKLKFLLFHLRDFSVNVFKAIYFFHIKHLSGWVNLNFEDSWTSRNLFFGTCLNLKGVLLRGSATWFERTTT